MTLHLLEKALGDPPVRLAYVDEAPNRHLEDLERFLATQVAHELQLTPAEIEDLRHWEWYSAHETPSAEAWADFVRLRRHVRDAAKPR